MIDLKPADAAADSMKAEARAGERRAFGDAIQQCAGDCGQDAKAGSCYCQGCEDKIYQAEN